MKDVGEKDNNDENEMANIENDYGDQKDQNYEKDPHDGDENKREDFDQKDMNGKEMVDVDEEDKSNIVDEKDNFDESEQN